MQDILSISKIDPRLGYKLLKDLKETARICFVGGRWQMKGAKGWFPLLDALALPESLRAWKQEANCSILFWACCGKDCRPPETRAFQDAVHQAGGMVSHGYCESCLETFKNS